MREAIRRPARDGVLNGWIQVLPNPSKANLPKPRFSESERLSYPSLILPRRPAHSARPTSKREACAYLGASWSKKSRSKRPSKTDHILIPFQHRFLSVLAPFWRAKMAPKSIKNRSKLSFQALIFTSIFHRFFFPTSTHWISKKYVFF